MDKKQFEDIMKKWAERERESAPKLRPTKEMYQAVKARKAHAWFPGFARWATVGVAAAVIVIVAMLHPGLVPLPPFQEKIARQETAPTEPNDEFRTEGMTGVNEPPEPEGEFRDEDVSVVNVTPVIEARKDQAKTRQILPPEPEAPSEKPSEDVPPGKGRRDVQQVVADKISEDAPSVEEIQSASQVAGDLDDERTYTEVPMTAQPEEDVSPAPGFAPMARSRAISELHKAKEEASPEESQPQPVLWEAEEEAEPEISTMKTLSVEKASLPEQRIGEKIFYLKDDVWIDAAYTPEQELLTIKRDSRAYRDLLAAQPDLQEYFDIGEHVIVVIGENALEIAAEGKTELTEEELKKVSEP